MSVEARTGRLRQRYAEDNLRLVSGCIPYKLTKYEHEDQNDDIVKTIEVCMVSSPNRSDLVFPKGGWEDDETVREAACREALEEAGVKGLLREKPLGVWEFRSKSRQDLHSLEGGCRGYMFALKVTEELDTYPEQENRHRKWLNIKDAFQLCRYEWMREALEEFVRVISEGQKIEAGEEIMEPVSVSEAISESQIMSSNYSVAPSSSQHRGISTLNSLLWQIPLKRLPLT